MNWWTRLFAAGTIFVCTSLQASETLSLAGDWRFEIAGPDQPPVARELTGRIRLPGTMDDARLGPTNTKSPTLEGPYRLYDYAGPAWYQRDIEIPKVWAGKRVTLLLERCRWVTTVWLDDKRIGSQDSLIAPHVYDFGTSVAAGRHRLTICVDNTVKLNLGKFVSALFGGTWGNMNGIIGRIELAATPPVWIDDIQVYPDVARKTARVKIRIGNATAKGGSGTLSVGTKSATATWDATGGKAELEVDMSGAKLWDEFAPNLTELTVRLGDDRRTVRFGMRAFATQGTQFTLNGRPIFLRGTLECSVWPLTGYPPTDVPAWQRIYQIMKSYGLNHIRFHSWCPPEAAFAAADLEGIMIQAEGPQANVPAGQDPERDAFIEAEFKRIVDTYGNHPSFCTMTLGNEFGGKDELITRWVEMLIQRDPRHLYSSASNNRQRTANRQFTVTPQERGITSAGTQRDLRNVVTSDLRPGIGHEIGQWMYFPDFKEIKKYTGVISLKNFEIIRGDLAKKNLLDLAPQYVTASGKFATLLYKEEIEVLLRTPAYAGFQLLDLHDYPTQGTALIGPLNEFWESKGFIAPEAYRRFCGPTVPLLRMPKRTFSADEVFEATVDVAHYGPADLAGAKFVWTIKDRQGREVASGQLPAIDVATGKLTSLGSVQASLVQAATPGKFTVTVALQGTEVSNDWEVWIYPANVTPQPPTDVAVCQKWDEAKAALAAGKKVMFFAASANTAQSMRGRFLPVFWSPVWFPTQKPNTMGLLLDPKHPLVAQFPTESHSNWQWYELMQHSRVFILDDTPAEYRPTLQVIDNFARNHKLGVVFEGRVGNGSLFVCGFDLPALAKDPAARQFLTSLYQYVGSAAFRPAQPLSDEMLEKLFVPKFNNKLLKLGARIRADSSAPGYDADQAIDGDPNTLWHTPWDDKAPRFPHHLIVELPTPVTIAGITCLPRQDMRNGWIKDFAVEVSDDAKDWKEVAWNKFIQDDTAKTVKFVQPVQARYLKFIALAPFDARQPYASLAELTILTEAEGLPKDNRVILSPPPAASPRINGPKVYGARPGHPFLYRIPCTGQRPMWFEAKGLPAGLALDADSGIITGTTPTQGKYPITLRAQNSNGKAERPLKLVVGDRLALTPSMGYNHWYTHYNRITQQLMQQAADVIISSGMADAGYQYVNIDDCWMNAPSLSKYQTDPNRVGPVRDANGSIVPNSYFPDMKGLADYIHAKGLKAGIYTTPGPVTCAGFGGAYGYEEQDARQFAAWGYDFLKYDWCSYSRVAGRQPDLAAMQKPYRLMGDLLRKQPRDIILNLCQYGMGDVWKWGAEVGGHSWRTGGDLGFELNHIFEIAMKNCGLRDYNRPGAWNDPDYIQIGWIGSQRRNGFELPRPCPLTPNEQYSFMSLWCLMACPLFYSGDMSKLDDFTLRILCNPELIDINQDSLGQCAKVIVSNQEGFILVKDLEDGGRAIGLCNRAITPQRMTVRWGDAGLVAPARVRDCWRGVDVKQNTDQYEIEVPPRFVEVLRLYPAPR